MYRVYQGALPAGWSPRGVQVPAAVELRAVLRGAAAQGEDEGGAREGVQAGCRGRPGPAGHHPVPVPGLLHPHAGGNQPGKEPHGDFTTS